MEETSVEGLEDLVEIIVVADGEGHGQDGEAECKSYAGEANSQCGEGCCEDGAAAAAEDKPEGAEELGCCTFREMHFDYLLFLLEWIMFAFRRQT